VFCVAIHIVEIYRDIGNRQQLSKIADDLVFVLVSVVIYRLRDEAWIRVRQVLRYCVNSAASWQDFENRFVMGVCTLGSSPYISEYRR
jgi:hypothetical protein